MNAKEMFEECGYIINKTGRGEEHEHDNND